MTSKKHKAPLPGNYDLFEYTIPGSQAVQDGNNYLPSVDELYRRFRAFNIRYFTGKLPTPKIRYSNRLLAAGLYIRDRGEIVISQKYHKLFPDDIDDTLKHEMIHILHFNHNAKFKQEAERIGAAYRAKSHPSLRLPPRYMYYCPACGTEYPRRKPIRMASCGKCSPSRFNPRYKLVLKSSFKQ